MLHHLSPSCWIFSAVLTCSVVLADCWLDLPSVIDDSLYNHGLLVHLLRDYPTHVVFSAVRHVRLPILFTFVTFLQTWRWIFRMFSLRSFSLVLHQISQASILTSSSLCDIHCARSVDVLFLNTACDRDSNISQTLFSYLSSPQMLYGPFRLASHPIQYLTYPHDTHVTTGYCNSPQTVQSFVLTFQPEYTTVVPQMYRPSLRCNCCSLLLLSVRLQKHAPLNSSMIVAYRYGYVLFSLYYVQVVRHHAFRERNIFLLSLSIFAYAYYLFVRRYYRGFFCTSCLVVL